MPTKFTGISICALSALALIPHQSQSQEIEKPNVIYILSDDMGIGDLGCYGQQKIQTPALDQLAENGIRFTQHYSGAPVSAPSRCTLMTGKHTGNAYIRGNKGVGIYNEDTGKNERYDWPLAETEITVATVFKQADYVTACAGKWGLGGPNTVGDPKNHGFDYFYGYLGQGTAHSYYPEYLHEIKDGITAQEFFNKQIYSHDTIMNKTLEFIDANADNPFFLYLTPTIPHAELVVPEGDEFFVEYRQLFGSDDNIPFNGSGTSYGSQQYPLAAYAAMVTRLDRDIQRILDLLDEKGILDNTIVMFSSDNGVHKEGGNRPDYFNSNGGYRGYKRDLYEGGIRTPFIVSWSQKIKTAKVSNHASAFWDFYPTVCDLLGISVPENVDGISFLPTITGEGSQQEHDYLYWEFHEQGGKKAVRKDNWKLVQLQANNYATGGTYQLFNLQESTLERDAENKLNNNNEKFLELKSLLESARTSNENWDFIQPIEIEGQEIVEVSSSNASSEQDGERMHKSHDQNFTTIYHSEYSNKISHKNPVELFYYFAPTVDLSTIVYATRIDDNQNGNFREFELWVQKFYEDTYTKIGDYDFEGKTGQHRIDLSGELKGIVNNIKSVKFVVKTGVNDFASCAEMIFYGTQKEYALYDIPNMERVEITSASASSEHNGREIKYAYDGIFDVNYHSRFGKDSNGAQYNQAEDYFPIYLNFYFKPVDITSFVYYTRKTGTNGNFKEFEVWGLPDKKTQFEKIGEYDFKGMSGIYQIDFSSDELKLTKNLRALQFKVLSGAGNFASCSEIVLYKPNDFTSVESNMAEENMKNNFFVRNGRIIPVGIQNIPFDVYSHLGIKTRNKMLPPGVYIVKSDNLTEKIVVN